MKPLTGSIEKMADLPWYTEGPVADTGGNIYFTTLHGRSIMKVDSEGNLLKWADSKCPNGQLILQGGDHLVCESALGAISRFNSSGRFLGHDLQGYCDGRKVHVPNDLAVDAEGGIYFSDSVRHNGKVCYYAPDGYQRIIADNLDFPNGVALSIDGRLLFIAESYRNRIMVISLRSGGVTEGKLEIFAELPVHPSGNLISNLPDGIKIDLLGRLWVAHYGMQAIQVLSPDGSLVNCIETGFPLTSNLCLHGNAVFVTGGYGEPGPGGLLKIVL